MVVCYNSRQDGSTHLRSFPHDSHSLPGNSTRCESVARSSTTRREVSTERCKLSFERILLEVLFKKSLR